MKKSTIALIATGAVAALAGVVAYAMISKKDTKCICSCSKDKKDAEKTEPAVEEETTEVVCEDCECETEVAVEPVPETVKETE